jgi:hypothetical protein
MGEGANQKVQKVASSITGAHTDRGAGVAGDGGKAREFAGGARS